MTADEWKALLRARLRSAMGAKDKVAISALRETLAAIDNAEAQPSSDEVNESSGPPGSSSSGTSSDVGPFAGSVRGLGAAEAPRRVLSHELVVSIIEREVSERRDAAAEYARLGRNEEAGVLSLQADALATLVADAS